MEELKPLADVCNRSVAVKLFSIIGMEMMSKFVGPFGPKNYALAGAPGFGPCRGLRHLQTLGPVYFTKAFDAVSNIVS